MMCTVATRCLQASLGCCALLLSLALASFANAGDTMTCQSDAATVVKHGVVHAATDQPARGISETGSPVVDYFTGGGTYMPRTHCLVTPSGAVDWPWIMLLLVLTGSVIMAYLRIFLFWMKSFFDEQPRDRNPKLFDLAAIFLWCAICGYAMSMVMFFWPGYRLLAMFLVVLNVFSWKFCCSLEPFRLAFSANRLERQLREELQSRAKELEKLVELRTREAVEARLQAEAANVSKTEFLANMSHEIRTPMTAILGFADLLQEETDADGSAEKRHEYVATIKRHSKHLLAIVNDILDLSKIEAGKLLIERMPTDVVEVMEEVTQLLRARAAGQGIYLNLVFESALPSTMLTDPTRLRQVLLNLVGNAVKFTEIGGVTLTASMKIMHPSRASLCVTVRDTGIGMTQEQISRLFGAFEQVDASTSRRFGGSGLGLRISKRLAEMMAAEITVSSAPGKGSEFVLTMDAGDPSEFDWIDPRAKHARARPSKLADELDRPLSQPLAGLRILLAEDGPDNRRLIAHILYKAGAKVTCAENGRMAIEKLMRNGDFNGELLLPCPYDVVLMDIQMPELDGYAATRILRAKEFELPIVALTAHSMTGDREKCLEAGCTEYASKPIDKDGLIEVIAEVVQALGFQPAVSLA